MSKVDWKPGNMVYPLPAVMVTVGNAPENYNIITIAWTGTICSDPPMCYISVRKGRHSYPILKETGEFVINLTTKDLAYATDWCGVRSGRQYDKFKEMNLTPGKASKVSAPIIEESPVNIECKVTQVVELGTHDMFMAEVVNVKADDKYIDEASGAFSLFKAKPICYSHGNYYEVGKKIGKFGYAVEKKKRKRPVKKR
ncbi:flavin reductase family protein [Labilibacter marinus]|uniref:flavin reductase family protein n=1 Tax=Labilibacter marinus TaxID=1477105 RepID=UPI00094F566B|nr:flavin reductase family protein [Labilibacter marinus]